MFTSGATFTMPVHVSCNTPTPGEHPVFGVADYYVGCSRAKSVLYVVAKQKADVERQKAA